MGFGASGREASGARRARDTEISPLEYGAAIVSLIAVAALALLSGCSSDTTRSVTGAVGDNDLDFGIVAVGKRVSLPLKIDNEGDAPLSILGIEAGEGLPADVELPALPSERIPIAGDVELTVAYRPGAEQKFEGLILLRTDSTEKPTVTVEVKGESAYPLVACTPALDFGRVVLNTDKVLRVTCLNNGRVDAELRVAGKEGEEAELFTIGENLVADPTVIPAGGSQLVEIRYTASWLGKANARALLEVLGAQEPILPVELTGEGFASDLVVLPNCLHFGSVSPGAVGEQVLTIHNGGNDTVTFEAPTVTDANGVFGITGSTVGGVEGPLETLEPGQQAQLKVTFAPTALGDYAGDLQVRSDDPTNPRINVCLTGRGGGPNLVATPNSIDFGVLGEGMRAGRWVAVANDGTTDGGDLQISGVRSDDPANFTVRNPTVTTIAPGGTPAAIEVIFHPQAVGRFSATITIDSNDGDTPAYEIPVTGEARVLPPCSYVAEPPSLRFGNVQTGAKAQLAAALRNTGAEDCVFSSVALSPGTATAFSLPEGPVSIATVAPGEALTVPVAFDGARAGDYSGALSFYVSSPTAPQGSVPITASAFTGCLVPAPSSLDFGEQRVSCPAVSKTVRLTNNCGASVRVDSIALGAGTMTAGEITITSGATPLNIAAGGSTTIQVRYDAVDESHDGAPIEIESSVGSLSVPVFGKGTLSNTRTDTFTQRQRQSVDVLFVVDNSGSMNEEQTAIATNFDEFIQYATSQGLDYHIGVTTTGITESGGGWAACPGGVDGGEAGRLFPADGSRPRWITPTTANPLTVFGENVKVGVCHWWEEGLEAAYRALSSPLVDSRDAPGTTLANDGNLGFYRTDARLAVIIVTDEDDHSDRDASFYINFFRGLKPGRTGDVTVSGVLGNGCTTSSGNGDKYSQVIQATGGTSESICTTDWGRALGNLAQSAFGFTLRFPLSGVPLGSVSVTVDGQAVTSGWRYDTTTNAVIFEEGSAPAPGSTVEITYTPVCGS